MRIEVKLHDIGYEIAMVEQSALVRVVIVLELGLNNHGRGARQRCYRKWSD